MRFELQRAAAGVICAAGGAVLAYLLLRFALPLLLPFFLALFLALITRPLCVRLSARTGLSPRAAALLVTLFALVLLALFFTVICNHLLLELQRLLGLILEDSADPGGELARVISFFRGLSQHLPLLSGLQQSPLLQEWLGDPQSYLQGQLQHFLSSVAERLASLAAALLRRLPGVLLFLLAFLISCFYFAMEYQMVTHILYGLLPRRVQQRLPEWRRRVAGGLKGFARAYALLFLLTLFELTLGFLVLGIRAPFLLALFTAFLDILPVLGVGTVLWPLAVFALISGKTGQGIGLLVLYAVITILRQIVEPRLLGKSLGVHPLLLLLCFYVGLKAFGGAGLLIAPAAALLLRELYCSRRE